MTFYGAFLNWNCLLGQNGGRCKQDLSIYNLLKELFKYLKVTQFLGFAD
jgi:hypothetical protein